MYCVAETTYLIHGGGSIFYSIIFVKGGISFNRQSLLSQSCKMNGNKLLALC